MNNQDYINLLNSKSWNYSHLDVLCDFSGIYQDQIRTPIEIQHGITTKYFVTKQCAKANAAGRRFFSWIPCSHIDRECQAIVIGSPWLYLPPVDMGNTERRANKNVGETPRRLFILPHRPPSLKNFDQEGFLEISMEWLDRFVLTQEDTLLLYWSDFLDRHFRREFERYRAKLDCVGFGGYQSSIVSSSNIGGRERYLQELRNLILDHEEIQVLEPSSAAWYAMTLRVDVFYDADFFKSVAKKLFDLTLINYDGESLNKRQVKQEFLVSNSLEMSSHLDKVLQLPRNSQLDAAREFLGLEYLLPKETIRRLLTQESLGFKIARRNMRLYLSRI